MERIHIAVLFGGCSTEYDVSLSSAASVLDNLDRDRYNIITIGITREGNWLRYEGSIDDIRRDNWHQQAGCFPIMFSPGRENKGFIEFRNQDIVSIPVDLVFPVLHGKNGEDGTVQGLLELSGIPYIGCDMTSSSVCMDKAIAHTLVRAVGIHTAQSLTVFAEDDQIEQVVTGAETLGYPLFVKPARSGSSIGITKVSHQAELLEAVRGALLHDHKVVIEQSVEGFEVGCAVLGNNNPIVGEIDEIELLSDGFFSYEEKYTLCTSFIHLPARVDDLTAARIKETALAIYQTLGCRGLARVDMFLTTDGQIVFNEVNTMPGFTSHSRYPSMLRAAGIEFPELLDRLIELAVTKEEPSCY